MRDATIENAIHVCRIAERFLEQIADGTEAGEYESHPFPLFEDYAKDFMEEEDVELVSRIAPFILKITQELFDDFS